MRNNTGFRRTQILVTKLVHLTIETGSVAGIYYLLFTFFTRLTPSTLAVVALLSLILFFVFPGQTFYSTPVFIMPRLYANTVYMVLNSRFEIIGGRDTSMSSTVMSLTTTMIRDILSQSTEDTRPVDESHEMQGLAPVIVISNFNDNHEMSQINVSQYVLCVLLELISP